jgi:predicted nucleotidyltransferase component of viral defense system
MHSAVRQMIDNYQCQTSTDYVHALREIMQEISLLGLWRANFFNKAAFYGGTALRLIYGLDRYSEDLDFSLLCPDTSFTLDKYISPLSEELASYGFDVEIEHKQKTASSAIQSAFLKTNTMQQILSISANEEIANQIPHGKLLKIKFEVDTEPPPKFKTEIKYLLHPIPFSVNSYLLPDLFAGKMHAILCRNWKGRTKGRDWYDLVLYASNFPELHLEHLQERLWQGGQLDKTKQLDANLFSTMINTSIESLDVRQAKQDVMPFLKNDDKLSIWSSDFFKEVVSRIVLV